MSMNDRQLWSELKSGDNTAFEKIYRQEFKYLYDYGKRLTSDVALVEDMLQDLFVDIWNRRTSLGSTTSIRAYLIVSLRRRIIKGLQQKQKTLNASDDPDYFSDTVLSIEQLIESKELSAEQTERIRTSISELSKRQKEVLHLRYFQDMDYKEIAEAMDINYQSVRNIASKAIKSLAKNLALWFFLIIIMS